MTKKEQREVDAQLNALSLKCALAWPNEAEPKPKNLQAIFADKTHSHLEVGWFAHVWSGGYSVSQGCSSAIFHSSSDTTLNLCRND